MNAAVSDFLPDIRPMNMADVPAVAAIEASAYQFPWSEKIFSDCLTAGYHGIVLTSQNEICGYAILSVAVGEAHLLNLCVDPQLQSRGYGSLMLDYLINKARVLGGKKMFLEVRPSNQVAIGMYTRSGFAEIGVRKNYYRTPEGHEDAVVYARDIVDLTAGSATSGSSSTESSLK